MRTQRLCLHVLVTALILFMAVPPFTAAAETPQPVFEQLATALGSTAASTWALGMADFNRDGIDDIIGGNSAGDVFFLKGNGGGTFAAGVRQVNAPAWDTCTSLAVGDFDQDGNQDFIGARTGGASVVASDGVLYLFAGKGDGTFQKYGAIGYERGLPVGDGGTDVMTLASADVDSDGDLDVVSGDAVHGADNARADILLWRNLGMDGSGNLRWSTAETISSMASQTLDPESAPYYPPKAWGTAPAGYGLAFGDMDDDGDQDLLVTDVGSYLYVYRNDGTGGFAPVRYGAVAAHPLAYGRLHDVQCASRLPIVVRDLNRDGMPDLVASGSDGAWDGKVDLWLNDGLDAEGRPMLTAAGVIGGIAGSPAILQGLAVGQVDPGRDLYTDVIFAGSNFKVYGLRATGELLVRLATRIVAVDDAVSATPPDRSTPMGCFAATLTDAATGAPVAGQTVWFYACKTANTSQCVGSAVTNASGVAWIRLPKGAGNLVKYTARYETSALYLGSWDDGTINGSIKK